jgi:hypothetical protein
MRKYFLFFLLFFVSFFACRSQNKLTNTQNGIEYKDGLQSLEKMIVNEISNSDVIRINQTQILFFKLTVGKSGEVASICELNNEKNDNVANLIKIFNSTSSHWINTTNSTQDVIIPLILIKDVEGSESSKASNPSISKATRNQILKGYFIKPIIMYFYQQK